MLQITITLNDEQARQLTDLAKRRGVAVEELAHQIVARTSREQLFREVLDEVLEKNAELYRRLAQGPRE